MATKKFGREPKMMTTEPSADELKHEGMKKGGHAHMARGGNPMMGALLARRMPTRRMPMQAQAPMGQRAPMAQPMMKRGGKAHHAEGGVEHRAEMKEMHKIEKELKHHESKKASKAHHGLKKGGMYTPQMGGLLGEGKPHHKGMTGGIEGTGYAHGGKIHRISGHPEGTHKHHMAMAKHHAQKHAEGGSAHHHKMHEHHKHMAKMCKANGGVMPMSHMGGAQLKHGGKHHAMGGLATKGDAFQTKGTLKPKINVQDKVHEAKQTKSLHTKSGGVEGVGYKHGGKMHKFAKGGTVSESVANRYLNDMQDGSKPHKKSGKTGEIHQAPAGFKRGGHVKHHADGGHVAHHTTHGHDHHGHKSMHEQHRKHEHGHTHIDAHPMKHGGHAKHHKKGGKCNY
jgi:hypothetical protein